MFQAMKAVPQPYSMSPCCWLDWASRMQESRLPLHHSLPDDMHDDIENKVSAENHYDLKGMTTTYEIVSWERLPVDCQSGVTS
jgi:hypothetical protein